MENVKLVSWFENINFEEGVYIGPEEYPNNGFEQQYFAVRNAENRIYSDSELRSLPYLKIHRHAKEWTQRAKSFERVIKYFKMKNVATFLDLGCGNGWFTNQLSEIDHSEVVGVDVNLFELKQAARVFAKKNLKFVNADIFKLDFPEELFDVIVLNASVQYFNDLEKLTHRLFTMMKGNGELHFIDSPFYSTTESEAAERRTQVYYHSMGFPKMASHYFHHKFDELKALNYDVLYHPEKKNRMKQLVYGRDIPFPWIRIRK